MNQVSQDSAPGFFSNWVTLLIEAMFLIVCTVAAFSWIEEFEHAESLMNNSNRPDVVSTPTSSPSPTPKAKPTIRRRSTSPKTEEHPLAPREKAPSPDIPPDEDTTVPNQEVVY